MYAGDQDFGAFTSPFFSSASSTPTSVPSFNTENGGGWNGGVSTFYRYTGFTGEPTDGYVYAFAYNGVSPGNTSETIKYSFANGWEDYPLNSTTTNPFSVNTSDGSTAIGGTTYPINTIVGLDTAGNFLFKFGHNATYPDPYYEAPPGVPIVQSIECTPQGIAHLMEGDYTTSYITYRFNSSDESITYTNGVGWEDLGSNRPFTISSPTGENIDLGMGWGTITLPNPYFVNGVEVGYEAPPSYFLSSPRAIGDWINCADNPFTWNGATYTLQRTGGSMKYTSDDGTSAIWTYCNSTGGDSQSGDSVKRLSSGGWEDGPGSRPNGNNSINEHNNVLFISHPNTPIEAVWGFDDPYDVSP